MKWIAKQIKHHAKETLTKIGWNAKIVNYTQYLFHRDWQHIITKASSKNGLRRHKYIGTDSCNTYLYFTTSGEKIQQTGITLNNWTVPETSWLQSTSWHLTKKSDKIYHIYTSRPISTVKLKSVQRSNMAWNFYTVSACKRGLTSARERVNYVPVLAQKL